MKEYEKTGYLNYDYKIFHIADNKRTEFNYHYHDFHKILIFLRGGVTYHVEGRSYILEPYDIVLVRAGEVHRPNITSDSTYERIILYVSPDYLRTLGGDEEPMDSCFFNTRAAGSNVLRIPGLKNSRLLKICHELSIEDDEAFQADLYRSLLFREFVILLNRLSLNPDSKYIKNSASNEKILAILDYINDNLTGALNAGEISGKFFISKYYLMHTFKQETGYTIGEYISTKRLLLARNLIDDGMSVTQACYACGYQNYSTFSRAYKKLFNVSASNNRREETR